MNLKSRELFSRHQGASQNGIAVTALHSHMWNSGFTSCTSGQNEDVMKLAKGLRAALDQTDSAKPK
jgi:hypothetical protein